MNPRHVHNYQSVGDVVASAVATGGYFRLDFPPLASHSYEEGSTYKRGLLQMIGWISFVIAYCSDSDVNLEHLLSFFLHL